MRVTPRGYYQKIGNRQLHNGSKENYNTTSDSIDQREKSMISKHWLEIGDLYKNRE